MNARSFDATCGQCSRDAEDEVFHANCPHNWAADADAAADRKVAEAHRKQIVDAIRAADAHKQTEDTMRNEAKRCECDACAGEPLAVCEQILGSQYQANMANMRTIRSMMRTWDTLTESERILATYAARTGRTK